jgi:hypothetical protein
MPGRAARSVKDAASGQRLAQHGALVVRVCAAERGPERRDRLAVGLDQRDVDAVERGAAHQPDRLHAPPSV